MSHDMEIELPFVRREMISPPDGSATHPAEPYYIVTLAELTPRRLGLQRPDWPIGGAELLYFESQYDVPQKEIPWGVFSNWIVGRRSDSWHGTGNPAWPKKVRDAKRAADAMLSYRILALFRKEFLNRYHSEYLEPQTHGAQWWSVPTHVPQGEERAGEEIVLALPLRDQQVAGFKRYYTRALAAAKDELVEDEVAELRSTLGVAVRALEQEIETNEKELVTPLRQLLQKLQSGHMLFQMVVDFAKPEPWRLKNFGDPKGLQYVVPDPSDQRRKRVDRAWTRWKRLTSGCAQLVVEERDNEKIDIAAGKVLEHLRDANGAVFRMFNQWDSLFEASRAELVETTLKALRLALRGAQTRKKILKGEFAEIAIAAGDTQDAIGPDTAAPLASSPRAQVLSDAIDNLSMATVFHDTDQTPLGQFVAAKLKSGTAAATHGAVALDVLALSTPYVTKALRAVDPTGATGTAWLWRAAVGCGKLSKKGQEQFWEQAQTLLWEGKLIKEKSPIRLVRKGAISSTISKLGTTLKVVNVLASCIVVFEGAEMQKSKDFDAGLKNFSKLMGLVKDTADLVATPTLFRLLSTGKEEAEALAKGAGAKVVPVLSIAADAIALAVSVREIYTSKTWSMKKREALVDNAMLDGLALAVSVAGLFVGAQFVVLGVLIFVVKELLQNPDSFMHIFPGIDKKPRTHLYLEGLLQSLEQEKDPTDPEKKRANPFRKTLESLSSQAGKTLRHLVKEELNLYDLAIPSHAPVLWEIGGKAGFGLDFTAESISAKVHAESRYHFPEKVAAKIVGVS